MRPFSPHTKFFSSLKQVEKRLKSEHKSPTPQQLPHPSTQPSSTDQLSAPLYLYTSCEQQTTNDTDQDSNPPQEFLSHSPDFPPSKPPLETDQKVDEEAEHENDGVQEVLELLGLLDLEMDGEEGKSEMRNVKKGCEGSFYSKIVGVKGPKSEKEVERLDGWIKYFLSSKDGEDDGGVKEPLVLIHLLIGKAAVAANEEEDGGGFGDIEFPSTVEEFLEHDPPTLEN